MLRIICNKVEGTKFSRIKNLDKTAKGGETVSFARFAEDFGDAIPKGYRALHIKAAMEYVHGDDAGNKSYLQADHIYGSVDGIDYPRKCL